MFKLLPDLSKTWIRDRISDEDIFEFYLGVSVQYNTKFCSPLRQDNTPTCNFFVTRGGTLYVKDHSGHFVGNCFDLVMFMYNINYHDSLLIIAKDFGLIDKNIEKKFQPKERRKIVQQKAKIAFNIRQWNQHDKTFWFDSYEFTRKDLNHFNIMPVKALWLNKNLHYTYNVNDPAYAYVFDPENIKVYFPKRTKARFICNTNALQGYNLLPESGKLLVVTKSYKDVGVLYKLGIPSVAPQSETQGLNQEQFDELSNRFEIIVSLYDFDLTGVRTANQMRKEFNIDPFFLTNGRFGSEDVGAKDVSDYVEAYDYASALAEFNYLTENELE